MSWIKERYLLVKKKTAIDQFASLLVVLILLVEYRFFFVIRFPDSIQRFMTYQNKILILLLSLIFFMCYGLFRRRQIFTPYIIFFISWMCISAFYAEKMYEPTINESIVRLIAYLTIIMYFPFKMYLQKNLFFFIRLLTYINIIAIMIMLIQFLVYKQTNSIFLQIYEFYRTGEVAIRNDSVRITYLGTIISLSTVLSIGCLFKSIDKRLCIINIIFSMLYFQFVSQTRMYVLALGATLIFQAYKSISNTRSKWFKRFIFMLGIFFAAFSLGIGEYLYNLVRPLLDGTYISDGSYYARLDSINHFLMVIKNHPIIGYGLFQPDIGSPYYYVIRGLTGHAMYTDVGILGVTAQFGIPFSLVFIFLLVKIYRLNKYVGEDEIINSLLLFIVFSSLTLIVLNPQRITFFAISLAIIDTIYQNRKRSVIL